MRNHRHELSYVFRKLLRKCTWRGYVVLSLKGRESISAVYFLKIILLNRYCFSDKERIIFGLNLRNLKKLITFYDSLRI